MLAGFTPSTNRPGRGAAELPRQPINAKAPPVRGVDFGDIFIMAYLRMVPEFVEAHDRAVGYFFSGQPEHPPSRRFALEAVFENFDEDGAIFHSPTITVKPFV